MLGDDKPDPSPFGAWAAEIHKNDAGPGLRAAAFLVPLATLTLLVLGQLHVVPMGVFAVPLVVGLVLTQSRMGNVAFFAGLGAAGVAAMVAMRPLPRTLAWFLVSVVVIDLVVLGSWVGVERVATRLRETTVATPATAGASSDVERVDVADPSRSVESQVIANIQRITHALLDDPDTTKILLSAAVGEMWAASNMAFALCPELGLGAVDALERHATPALRERYLAKLISGEWSGTMNLTEPQIEAGGRLGFYISDGPEKWPLHFMDANFMPPEMSEAMRQAVRTSGPSLQVSKMTPRDMDLGFTNVAEDTFEGFARQPWMRYAMLAVFVYFVFYYVYRLLQ